MFKDLSIKKKFFLGFGSILAIILAVIVLAYINFGKLSAANVWDKHTLEVLNGIENAQGEMLQVQSSVRGYMLTADQKLAQDIPTNQAECRKQLASLLRLTQDNAAQTERFKRVSTALEEWIATVITPELERLRQSADLKSAHMQAETLASVTKGARLMAEMRTLLDEATADENRLLAIRSAESKDLQQTMSTVLTVGGLAAIVLSIVAAIQLSGAILNPLSKLTHTVNDLAAGKQDARVEIDSRDELGQISLEFNRMAQALQENLQRETAASNALRAKVDALLLTVSKAAKGDLTGSIEVGGEDAIGRLGDGLRTMFANLRDLINNVQKAGISVTTSATEIAASSKQQEATGIEQAQTSVEVLSTTKEISANTQQLLRTMEEATSVADYTTNATGDAQVSLKRMDDTMQRMVSATDSINAKLAALSEKASNINSVLVTITKVADQTNILSLNAAIEAEKAGDAGRGFSVVATEIRRLADQTSVSTWDIEQMLKEMQSAVSASVMGMDKFSEEIRRSVGEVRQVAEQLGGVMDQVQKLAPQFDVVLQGMQSQAVGAQQITETMNQLNDATQQTVESLKATSEAVHQLQYAASDLQSSVANFSLNA